MAAVAEAAVEETEEAAVVDVVVVAEPASCLVAVSGGSSGSASLFASRPSSSPCHRSSSGCSSPSPRMADLSNAMLSTFNTNLCGGEERGRGY